MATGEIDFELVFRALIRPHAAAEFGFRQLIVDQPWAFAVINAANTNPAEAVFRYDDGVWTLVVLGTDIDQFVAERGLHPDVLADWRAQPTRSQSELGR